MNPLLETTGQIAALIICVFLLVLILLTVAFNHGMAFGMSWLSEKIRMIKMLRPTVESVNQATESALEGMASDQNENRLIRTAASIPVAVHNVEKQIDQATNKVADAVIEFRARTVQAKTILKAFLLPGSMENGHKVAGDKADIELYSAGYQTAVKRRPEGIPADSPPDSSHREYIAPEEQIQHSPIH